ncbi:MAG TPA: Gfo/Idh/MocA family oxidoreductase [Candidatus Dormibacteraeota bacterium]
MTRIGLVGLGTMGRNHMRVLNELDDATLVAVCDEDASIVAAACEKHGMKGYGSWVEMFDREDLDAAIVAVPTRFHREVGLAALERGLHVLVEKPIAASLKEGRDLVEAAVRARRLLAVGHIERFNPAVRELQRRVGAGELGRVFQVQARRQGPFPARIRDVGVVIDLATHDLDVMCHLVDSEVDRVYGETAQRIHTEHEDLLNALLKFDGGAVGVLQVNWLTPTKIRELSVLGERGLFLVDYLTQELTHFKNAEEALPNLRSVSEGEMVWFPITKAEPLKLELMSFLDAVREGRKVEVDGEAGMRALHLALALVKSASEGRVIGREELAALRSGGSRTGD